MLPWLKDLCSPLRDSLPLKDLHQDLITLEPHSNTWVASEIMLPEIFQDIWDPSVLTTINSADINVQEVVTDSSVCKLEDNASAVTILSVDTERPTTVHSNAQETEMENTSVEVAGPTQFGLFKHQKLFMSTSMDTLLLKERRLLPKERRLLLKERRLPKRSTIPILSFPPSLGLQSIRQLRRLQENANKRAFMRIS